MPGDTVCVFTCHDVWSILICMRTCSVDDCSGKLEARGLCSKHYQRAKSDGTLRNYVREREPGRTCQIDGCEKAHAARGYCKAHAQNFARTGNPYSLHEQKAMQPKPICSVDGCASVVNARGLCKRHYQNLLTIGDPVPEKDLPIEERMRRVGWTETVTRPELGPCWEWDGKRNDNGYGIVNAVRQGYDGARAHRVMYELTFGAVEPGIVVRHECDNPPCVNPEHLRVGSQWQNTDDMATRQRSGQLYENRGNRCRHGHDMTLPGAFRVLPNRRNGRTYRVCVECARRRGREYRARQRAL